jgi:tetratricopeptide (TPR) repeat protein
LANLAWGYYQKQGRLEEALKLYEQSLLLESQKPVYTKAATLSNMAGIHYLQKDYDGAVKYYQKALRLLPKHEKSRYWMAKAYAAMGAWGEAQEHLRILLAKRKYHRDYLNLAGFVHLKRGRPEKALPYYKAAMGLAPNDRIVLFNIGVTLSKLGSYANADWFMRRAHQMHSSDALPIFCLLENSIRAKNSEKIKYYAQMLINRYSPQQIRKMLNYIEKEHSFVPIATELIADHFPNETAKVKWTTRHAHLSP